jgi:hypothetical protein
VGWGAVALGVVGAGVGGVLSASAIQVSHGGSPTDPQSAAAQRNDRINAYNTGAAVAYTAGAAAVVAGVILILWPEQRPVPPLVESLARPGGVSWTF